MKGAPQSAHVMVRVMGGLSLGVRVAPAGLTRPGQHGSDWHVPGISRNVDASCFPTIPQVEVLGRAEPGHHDDCGGVAHLHVDAGHDTQRGLVVMEIQRRVHHQFHVAASSDEYLAHVGEDAE